MASGGVSRSKGVSSVYTFGNSHYNQVQTVPVTPVKRIKGANGVSKGEDKLKTAVLYGDNKDSLSEIMSMREANQAEELRESYSDMETASYDTDNPYELERMSKEGSLLLGMNVDEYR